MQFKNNVPRCRGGGGGHLFGLYRYVPLNRVCFSRTGSLSNSAKTCDERSTFAIPIICFLNIYFNGFSVKNYLILHVKPNKSGSKSSASCLEQGSEMSNFCLKQGRGLKASAAHLYLNFH